MDETQLLKLFSTNLNNIMLSEEMTQEQLANVIGVSQQMVSRYINAISMPSFLTVVKIADALFCSVDDLIEDI